jgi:4-aminobutyrate aminotransferase-like enzyme
MSALAAMATRHPNIGDVRGKGLMIGVAFVSDRATKVPAPELRNRVNHGFCAWPVAHRLRCQHHPFDPTADYQSI